MAADRVLHIVPVVHSAAELGSLAPAQQSADAERVVAAYWEAVPRRLGALMAEPRRLRLYQDGLPVCGKETELIADLARAGSANYRLLHRLIARGARVEGTESGPLLTEEVALHKQIRASGGPPNPAQQAELTRLLSDRDRFIAERIHTTLKPREWGLLFIGALHQVEAHLEPDIAVRWPVTRVHRTQ